MVVSHPPFNDPDLLGSSSDRSKQRRGDGRGRHSRHHLRHDRGVHLAPADVDRPHRRHHHQFTSILVIDLLLGWTLVGWAVALAMALSATSPTPTTAAGWYPDNSGAMRWWDGVRWTDHVQTAQLPPPPGQSWSYLWSLI